MSNSRFSLFGMLTELATALALVFILTACGGGGGEPDPDDPGTPVMSKLTLEVTGNGTISGNSGSINCGDSCTTDLAENTQVSLSASADSGFVFDRWTGACSGSGACSVVMNGDKTVAAVFVAEGVEPDPAEYSLTVSVTGSGDVNSNPAGINCGNSCSANFDEDTQITLQATPQSGFRFDGWTGACSGTGSCSVNMSANQAVSATFSEIVNNPTQYTLNVSVSGNGTITSNPSGINCGNDCSQAYDVNTQVQLAAQPQSGYTFQGWSGACSGTGSCSFNMNGNKTVSAVFTETTNPTQHTLSVSVSGNGTISSNPSGINCGNDCSQAYDANTQVQLAAQPQSGYVFQMWTGACSGSGQCAVTMNSNKAITAVFVEEEATEYNLNVTSNNGSIFSDPSGISCGNDCSAMFTENSTVALVATPDDGYVFDGWSGACSGTGSCNVTMNDNKSVVASFSEDATEKKFNLQVAVNGMGSVLSSPSGIDCGADCDEEFVEDTQISLSPTPDSGYKFDHWSGACSGNGSCSVTMTSDKVVTAVFIEDDVNQADVLISDYSPSGDAFQLGEIPNNASGITWHEGLRQYLVVRNNSAIIYRYDQNFAYLGQVRISGIPKDTEGLSFVGGNEVMVVNEANYAHKIEITEFNTNVDGGYDTSQGYRLLPSPVSNKGLEGTAIRKAANGQVARVFACQEGTGSNNSADMKVVYFDMPDDTLELLSYNSDLTVVEPFDAEQAFSGVVTDIAGMVFDERTGHLIIVSQESRKAIQVNPDTGAIISQLAISGAPQYEGVTIGPNGELVFVSEANWIRIYTKN